MVEKIGNLTFFISILLIGTLVGTVMYGNYVNSAMTIMVDQEQLNSDTPELLQTKAGHPFPWDAQRFSPTASNLCAVNLSLSWLSGAIITVEIFEWAPTDPWPPVAPITTVDYSLPGSSVDVPAWVKIDFPAPIPVDAYSYRCYLAVYTNVDGNAAWWGYDPDVGQGYDYTWRNSTFDSPVDEWDYGFRTYFETSSSETVSHQKVPAIAPLGLLGLIGLIGAFGVISIRKRQQ